MAYRDQLKQELKPANGQQHRVFADWILEVYKDNPEICWKFILTGDFHLATPISNIFSPRARKTQELLLRARKPKELLLRCLPTLYLWRLVAIYCPKMVLIMKLDTIHTRRQRYMPHKQRNRCSLTINVSRLCAIEIFRFHTLRLFFPWAIWKFYVNNLVSVQTLIDGIRPIQSRKYDSHFAI